MATPLARFDQLMRQATESPDEGQNVPNAAVVAIDANGNIIHTAEFGSYTQLSPSPSATGNSGAIVEPQKFTADTICWMASCTKLMVTVATLQCVEKGLLTLHDDITDLLPELKDPKLLIKMVDDPSGGQKPIYRESKGKITLSNCLTHSNGTAYDFSHPKTNAWSEWIRKEYKSGRIPKPSMLVRAYARPLLYEPDQGWSYGFGTDWAGIAVSRVSGLSLEDYMQRHIWGPLGMTSTTFYPRARASLLARTAALVERDNDGKLRVLPPDHPFAVAPSGADPESGGGGCYGSANDYAKLLASLLRNDGRLLKPETVRMMFSPQLKDPKYLNDVHSNPLSYGLAGNIPVGTGVDFGYGGILNIKPIEKTGRSPGGMQWGGLPNLFWWINPGDGVCGCYFGQLLPQGDPQSFQLYEQFEKAVMDTIKEKRGSRGRI